MYMFHDGTQISPCIISKVKAALRLPNNHKGNKKKCSYRYWVRTIIIIADVHHLPPETKQRAYDYYKLYISSEH